MKTRYLRGFTLIELLVVISIIALLLSILMPALSKVRVQARQAVCVSNCRQWSLATVNYAVDNEDKFPLRYYEGSGDPGFSSLPYYYVDYGGGKVVDLLGNFVEPYLGEHKYTVCPGDKDGLPDWETQKEEYAAALRPAVEGHYGIFVGYDLLPGGVQWGNVHYRGEKPPLTLSGATGSMATVGCIVRNLYGEPWSWWYKHPYRPYGVPNPEKPKGQPSAFVDGSASFFPFEKMMVHTNWSGARHQFWWPDPKGIGAPEIESGGSSGRN